VAATMADFGQPADKKQSNSTHIITVAMQPGPRPKQLVAYTADAIAVRRRSIEWISGWRKLMHK